MDLLAAISCVSSPETAVLMPINICSSLCRQIRRSSTGLFSPKSECFETKVLHQFKFSFKTSQVFLALKTKNITRFDRIVVDLQLLVLWDFTFYFHEKFQVFQPVFQFTNLDVELFVSLGPWHAQLVMYSVYLRLIFTFCTLPWEPQQVRIQLFFQNYHSNMFRTNVGHVCSEH